MGVAAVGLAGLLGFITACRDIFVHKDNNYERYRQLTGFSMFVMEAISVGIWVALGILWFAVAMLVTCVASYLMIRFYEWQLARDECGRELDKSFTKLLIGITAVLAVVGVLFEAVGW